MYDARNFEEMLPPIAQVEEEKKARQHSYEPRSIDEVRAALTRIPMRIPGTETYMKYRNILWGLIKAVMEAGSTREEAVALMEQHSSQWNGIEQIANSGGIAITAASFWWHAKEHGC